MFPLFLFLNFNREVKTEIYNTWILVLNDLTGNFALRWAEKWVCCNSVTRAWCSGGVMPMEEPARGKEERMYSTSIAHKGWFELWCISLLQIKADTVALHRVRESIGLGWITATETSQKFSEDPPVAVSVWDQGCVEISPLPSVWLLRGWAPFCASTHTVIRDRKNFIP